MKESKIKQYRVKFVERDEKQPFEVVVTYVGPSEFFGLIALEGFVFSDQKKFVILPEEDVARKRFGKTTRLHVPYHKIVFVEEFDEEPADLKNLPFIREIPAESSKN